MTYLCSSKETVVTMTKLSLKHLQVFLLESLHINLVYHRCIDNLCWARWIHFCHLRIPSNLAYCGVTSRWAKLPRQRHQVDTTESPLRQRQPKRGGHSYVIRGAHLLWNEGETRQIQRRYEAEMREIKGRNKAILGQIPWSKLGFLWIENNPTYVIY